VCGHAEFERGTFGESLRPVGGGGTHFAPAFTWLKEHDIEPACAVYLTDLEGGFGEEPDYPVLWVSTTRKVAPWGRTIHMGDAR
jgi:predicted metal-dependent peptidase